MNFLIKVMLSAQSKDVEVNKYGDILFKKFPSLEKLNLATLNEIEEIIKPLGFSKNKSLNIKNISNDLIIKFNSKVPSSKKELMSMRGIGNKTANCILNELFHQNYIAVDTHVLRVCKRLKFADNKTNPLDVENWLMKNLPPEDIFYFSNRVIYFGRNICLAKKPKCDTCKMKSLCDVK